MEFELLRTDLLKAFEKKVPASVSKCFKDLSETDFTVHDSKHYLLAGAVASSQIEVRTLAPGRFFVSKANHKNTREVREIEHLVKAYQYVKRCGLTQKGLLKCHEILSGSFTHITKGPKGRYRKTEVGIRGWQRLVYPAVEPQNVQEEMNKLFADISVLLEKTLTLKQVLYDCAYIHFIFAKIHPFADGNGRAARLLEKWFPAAHLGTAVWSIPSEKYYYDNRTAYYNGLNTGTDHYETLKQSDRILPFLTLLPKAICYKPVD